MNSSTVLGYPKNGVSYYGLSLGIYFEPPYITDLLYRSLAFYPTPAPLTRRNHYLFWL